MTLYCGFALSLVSGCATVLAADFCGAAASRLNADGASQSADEAPTKATRVNSAAPTNPATASLMFEMPMVRSAPFASEVAAADAPHAAPREIANSSAARAVGRTRCA